MASLNKVQIIGNLGRDPEIRYMPDGTPTATISVATTDKWKTKEGEAKEKTEWHRVVFFRGLAEVVGKYLKSGAQVYVEGKLRTRKWTDKDGIERYSTEIQASDMRMLDRAQQLPAQKDEDLPPQSPERCVLDDMSDPDIPF